MLSKEDHSEGVHPKMLHKMSVKLLSHPGHGCQRIATHLATPKTEVFLPPQPTKVVNFRVLVEHFLLHSLSVVEM